MKANLALLFMLTATMGSSAMAQDSEGIPLTIRVVDAATGQPIRTAKVRHPEERDPHPVNSETGKTELRTLWLPNGDEKHFKKGDTVVLEVSAPGYENHKMDLLVKKRKNSWDVPLKKMEIDFETEDPESITLQFGRDKPLE